jgi:hypothetical protein
MEEKLSEQQQEQLRLNETLNEWLGESRFTARLIADIDEALSILAGKRTTLEEKMITKELHAIAAEYCSILRKVHSRLRDSREPAVAALESWRTLNFNVHEVINSLLKALRYNLNFVEQYFEFDFVARLTNEWQFAVEASRIDQVLND